MKARLSINIDPNDISEKHNFHSRSILIDLNLECRMIPGESVWFVAEGFEWMGECVNAHHLIYGATEHSNNHLPMFYIIAHAVRKLP